MSSWQGAGNAAALYIGIGTAEARVPLGATRTTLRHHYASVLLAAVESVVAVAMGAHFGGAFIPNTVGTRFEL